MEEPNDKTQEFEEALKRLSQEEYVLRLFVAGMSPKSIQAIENIKHICEMYLAGRCQLEVIDVYQQPILAKDWQIVAAPTLVKELPPPLRRLVGSMADTERVQIGMDLHIGTGGKIDPTLETKSQKSKDNGRHHEQV
jgi:circadian clock protein KaiB